MAFDDYIAMNGLNINEIRFHSSSGEIMYNMKRSFNMFAFSGGRAGGMSPLATLPQPMLP